MPIIISAYKELGDFTNSVKYHLKAVELAPNFGHGYYSLGIVYFESELYDQSAKAFQKSIELEFKPADSYSYLGHIYKDSQQCAKAIEAYKKAVELQPAYEIYIKSYKESCEKYLAESNAFRILTIERCCSADFDCADRETDEFCIAGNVAPGRSITILMGKNQLCFAKTGEHSVIITDIGETPGTALTDVACKSLNDGAIAVVNEVVKDHEKLELREIKDAILISALEGKIETGGLLDNFKIQEDGRQYLPKSATIYQYPYPGRKVFFVLYDPQPLILMNNDIYDLLSGSRECLGSKLISAFKVNKRYYVQVLRCACETDACGDEFVEIKSN